MHPTFWMYSHADKPYHIDRISAPDLWPIRSVAVCAFEDWSELRPHPDDGRVRMSDLQPDSSIEGMLAAAPADLWDRLFQASHAFLAESEHSTWGGGQQVGTTVVDGEVRPVLQMPYAVYSDNVDRIIALLHETGVVHPFDWSSWDGVDRYRNPAALRTAPVADAARMATAIIRSERFCEGSIAAAIANGTFSAILERLLRWYDSER